jgi:hypothetical protein
MQHIEGKITLGAYALDAESHAQWVCFDADDEGEWSELWQFAKRLKMAGLNPYIELSRRGGHLWLFTPHMTGTDTRKFALQLAKVHELPEGIELYPKQDELTTGVGSLVRLPLGIHRKSGKRYHFITLKREPLAPSIREQMAVLAQPKRVSPKYIQHVLASIKPEPLQRTEVIFERKKVSSDLPVSERIKRAVSVTEFVGRFVELDSRGRGLCPFHDDTHHSFQVNHGRNFWHCYAGCGGGSVIDFYMKWRAVHGQDGDFTATVTEMAQMLLD